jgi:hypothetical protein
MVERRLMELHIVRARERALRVFTFSSSVFPQEWGPQALEAVIMDLFELAFHTRRIFECCSINDENFRPIDRFLVNFSVPISYPVETRFRSALNGLTHARKFTFGWTHADHRRNFLASEANLMPTYVVLNTDHDKTDRAVSLFGLADAFLTDMILAIKRDFPEFQF